MRDTTKHRTNTKNTFLFQDLEPDPNPEEPTQRKKVPKGALKTNLKDGAAFEPISPIISKYMPKLNWLIDTPKNRINKLTLLTFFTTCFYLYITSYKSCYKSLIQI